MASANKYQCIGFAVLLILGSFAFQAMSRSLQDASISEKHKQWMARYGRVYKDSEEREKRLKIFKDNVEYIESFNKAANKPYKLGLNPFTDLTNEEFKQRNTLKITNVYPTAASSFRYENLAVVPSSMDWRNEGAVTPVKNQGPCGCCWAFSVVAAMEGINKLKNGNLISLSEQELLDCDTSTGNDGCKGGLLDNAFFFILINGGLTTEANYPYQGTDGTCNTQKAANFAAKITGYENVTPNNESALLNAAANQPVSVSIDGGDPDFQHYSSGVFTGECGTALDHAVAIIGFGTSDDGIKYWLVKNSWGTGWGEEGYMRIQRDIDAPEGLCGIAMFPSYPTA